MKTLYKTMMMLFLLIGLAVSARAQYVIGSWQAAPAEPNTPTAAYDEGWDLGQSGFGPNGSIFSPANCPSDFDVWAGVAAGYAQSLVLHETGYGNVRLYIQLTAAQVAELTNNTTLNFTLSVPAATDPSGYVQQVDFQYNSDAIGGFHNGTPSAGNQWTETGDTGNNSGGQPVFDFWSGATARQQVVSWNYAAAGVNFTGASYVQFCFVFQSSDNGSATNLFINNVNFSGATYIAPSIIIDQFNPTNNPYAGTNVYESVDDEITNVYNLWAGYGGNTAVDPNNGGITWDSTQDASNNPNSGSLKLVANFTGANQYLVWDRGPNNSFALNPPITNGYGLVTFEFDLMVDPSSPQYISGIAPNTSTNYGPMECGPVPPYGPIDFGGGYFYYDVTNTGWIHVVLPIQAQVLADPADLLSISGVYFKQYAFGMNGTTTLWIDNIKFTYTNTPPVVPPPTVAIQKPSPGLRLFTGGSDTYGRTELIAQQSESWVNATPSHPASYSFNVKSIPTNMGQTAIFLIPESTIPDTSYNGQDYNAANELWLTISPAGAVQVAWKTNAPGSNPGNIALATTITPVVGNWTLSFTGPNNGTVAGPNGTPVPFVITNGTVTTDFADPVWAYFGCQPNSGAAIGAYEDWNSISITGTASPISEDFTTEPTRSFSGAWATVYQPPADAGAAVIVSTSDMPCYWVNWTAQVGFDIGSKTNLLQAGQWISPQYYSGYYDNTAPYGNFSQFGQLNWVLEPSDDLPTANGQPGGPLAPNAYFLVSTNVVFP